MNNIDLTTLSCKRCGHTWIPRSFTLPRVCPKCNSPYWDKERGWYDKMKKNREERKKRKDDDVEDLTELSYDLRDR